MKIPIDEAILSCAEVAEQAYGMLLSVEVKDESTDKADKICGMLAVLALTLDELTEHVSELRMAARNEGTRLQSPPSETKQSDD